MDHEEDVEHHHQECDDGEGVPDPHLQEVHYLGVELPGAELEVLQDGLHQLYQEGDAQDDGDCDHDLLVIVPQEVLQVLNQIIQVHEHRQHYEHYKNGRQDVHYIAEKQAGQFQGRGEGPAGGGQAGPPGDLPQYFDREPGDDRDERHR